MKILGNTIWLILGGLGVTLEYFASSLVLTITIIGIPFGIATMKPGIPVLWPFDSHVVDRPQGSDCVSVFMSVPWFLIGGTWIALMHLGLGLLLGITIAGIPWAKVHFRLMRLTLTPFGKQAVNDNF